MQLIISLSLSNCIEWHHICVILNERKKFESLNLLKWPPESQGFWIIPQVTSSSFRWYMISEIGRSEFFFQEGKLIFWGVESFALERENLRIAATEEIFRRKPDELDEYSHSLRNKHQTTVVMGLLIKSHLKKPNLKKDC